MKKVEIKDLQPQIQELDDSELSGVVGGGLLDNYHGPTDGSSASQPGFISVNTTLNLGSVAFTLYAD